MNKKEFAAKVIGLPWVNRAYSYEQVDCHGLIYLFYRDVIGIDIGLPPSYYDTTKELDVGYLEEINTGNWVEVDRIRDCGMVLTCYKGERPVHVGIALDSVNILHAWGSPGAGGDVKITPLSVIKRMFGKVTFHVRKEQL